MTRYRSHLGDEFTASSPRDLVRQMRLTSFNSNVSDEAYMAVVRERIAADLNVDINATSAEAFVASLMNQGLLKQVPK